MNVKIIRVLNTNAVVSVDSQGMELIMTGPGIGFKKRKGENHGNIYTCKWGCYS